MTGVRSRLAFGLSVLGATGCMSTATIQNLPLSQGKERTFVASFDSLVAAARQAMEDEGLQKAADLPVGDSLVVMTGENRFSLFGPGSSIVRLVLERRDPAHLVRILTHRQDALNLTAETDYSASLFHRIDMELTPFPPGSFIVAERSTVRLHLAEGTVAGRFVRSTADSVWIVPDGGTVRVFPMAAVRRLETPLDASRRRAERSAWITTASVAGGFATVIWALSDDCQHCGRAEFLVAVAGIPLLTNALGRMAASATGKRWVAAKRMPRSDASISPVRDSTSSPSRADAARNH